MLMNWIQSQTPQSMPGNYRCVCPKFYGGTKCERALNVCAANNITRAYSNNATFAIGTRFCDPANVYRYALALVSDSAVPRSAVAIDMESTLV
jgi:hypothetical protein